MKRVISVLIVFTTVLSACGQSLTQRQAQFENKSEGVVETGDKIRFAQSEEPLDMPTERTVDTHGEYPWNYFFHETIAELQDNGETVYIITDVEPIEEAILKFSLIEYEEPFEKDPIADSWANYLGTFIVGVNSYMPEKYVEKMEEVEDALRSYNYDSIPDLIAQAKQLR